MNRIENQAGIVLGQKYAYATVSLVLGIACFINLLGMEKGILAIVFGLLALRSQPAPSLTERRASAIAGVSLGAILLIVLPAVLLLHFDRARAAIDVLTKAAGK